MAQLVRDRDTKRRDGRLFSLPMSGGVRIFSGSIVFLDADGYAVPAYSPTAESLTFPCLALETIDNREGAAGDKSVNVERTVIGLDYTPGVDRPVIGSIVFALDDHTVTDSDTDTRPVGRLVDIQDGQAWVDLTQA